MRRAEEDGTGVLPDGAVGRALCTVHRGASRCCSACGRLSPQEGSEETRLSCLVSWRTEGALGPAGVSRDWSAVLAWVDGGALVFKVFSRNPRLGQLFPGRGVLYSGEFFFGGGRSLSPGDLIVNTCVFINNFCIHCVGCSVNIFDMPKLYRISSYSIDSSFSDHRLCICRCSESEDCFKFQKCHLSGSVCIEARYLVIGCTQTQSRRG